MKLMKNSAKYLVAAAITAFTSASFAQLAQGSFIGKSDKQGSITNDRMTLLIKKDQTPGSEDYYAILAEYDLLVFSKITKWINRMYAYKMVKQSDLIYAMVPLFASSAGDLEIKYDVQPSALVLKKAGSLEGAILSRSEVKDSTKVVERIKFTDESSGSTWENFIAGKYLGTQKTSGLDYFQDKYNMEITKDGVARFNYEKENIKGDFQIHERIPGVFYTLTPKSNDVKGLSRVQGRIGFFVDIVNQKPKKTNDEFMMINPLKADDIGFYYEREGL
ncbi:hypothetical protein [Pseudobdellovibrio sp. HCB154]|uniref:hypothetical protein n=1 Tax=Pseudobdellovibrio sp. HCB154 TaxID=3386277 RepID=UPI0039172C7C